MFKTGQKVYFYRLHTSLRRRGVRGPNSDDWIESLALCILCEGRATSPPPTKKRSNEWFIEDQAFSPSYDLAPPPLSSQKAWPATHISETKKVRQLAYGNGGGGAKSYDSQRAWSSINHLILSAPPPPPVSKLDRRHTSVKQRKTCLQEMAGGGAKSYDSEKAWSSINNLILSAPPLPALGSNPPPPLHAWTFRSASKPLGGAALVVLAVMMAVDMVEASPQ